MRRRARDASLGRSRLVRAASLCLLCGYCSAWGGGPPVLRPSPPAHRLAAVRMLDTAVCIDLESPVPPGPDPYKMVTDDLDYIKNSIKSTLKAKNKGSGGSALSSRRT